jgi:hypothetical protein
MDFAGLERIVHGPKQRHHDAVKALRLLCTRQIRTEAGTVACRPTCITPQPASIVE